MCPAITSCSGHAWILYGELSGAAEGQGAHNKGTRELHHWRSLGASRGLFGGHETVEDLKRTSAAVASGSTERWG
jgi:hypothetical protein